MKKKKKTKRGRVWVVDLEEGEEEERVRVWVSSVWGEVVGIWEEWERNLGREGTRPCV